MFTVALIILIIGILGFAGSLINAVSNKKQIPGQILVSLALSTTQVVCGILLVIWS